MMEKEQEEEVKRPIIEGQQPEHDLSYQWVQKNNDIKQIEEGISILEFSENKAKRNLDMEFRLIRRITESQHHNENLQEYNPNINKMNRYNNIIPYKHSAVKIHSDDDNEDISSTYINANWINTVMSDETIFIATQGPLQCTFDNFWKMVWHCDCTSIMMLCNLKENDRPQCDQYWPKLDETIQYNNITVTNQKEEIINQSIQQRFLIVQKKQDENSDQIITKHVTQYQLVAWNDHGVPKDEDFPIIDNLVNILLQQYKEKKKTIVHCSAGVGRTGTLISLLNLMLTIEYFLPQITQYSKQEGMLNQFIMENIFNDKLEQNKLKNCRISIFGVVRRLREQRWGMVHTSEQYAYLYRFIEKKIQLLLSKLQINSDKVTNSHNKNEEKQ